MTIHAHSWHIELLGNAYVENVPSVTGLAPSPGYPRHRVTPGYQRCRQCGPVERRKRLQARLPFLNRPSRGKPTDKGRCGAGERPARPLVSRPLVSNGNIRMLINRGRGYKNMRYLLLKAKRMAVTNTEYVAFQKIRKAA